MTDPYRVLVTGSRDWNNDVAVQRALQDIAAEHPEDGELVLVHGACRTGADFIAHEWAVKYGCLIEAHPAAWWKYGRVAGPRRNKEMIDAGADVCLAFIRNSSRGATHCADLAERAGIPVRRFTA
ncbi:SLOG family protein [Streptomyces caniscabiei]|uniref:SLOG family protein n=1 Tax=Streptomyces caniscabiei TaxID=2746961 RepID=UPI0018731579|nr:SLOG family protein [Streptomyces caniscabiei]MBE4796156.1 DUF2493 domain-containing protein [Streptomyces caniscabiei]MDX2944464.1 SLOG family protein [Streptomyces caniscabiei]